MMYDSGVTAPASWSRSARSTDGRPTARRIQASPLGLNTGFPSGTQPLPGSVKLTERPMASTFVPDLVRPRNHISKALPDAPLLTTLGSVVLNSLNEPAPPSGMPGVNVGAEKAVPP